MARRESRQEALPWWRLRHEDLGMPGPAVYIPQSALPPDTCGMWGFSPIAARDATAPLPYACQGDKTLAADLHRSDHLDVLIIPNAIGPQGVVDHPELLVSGKFTDPHPPAWCWRPRCLHMSRQRSAFM
jgi:hypothetical protein